MNADDTKVRFFLAKQNISDIKLIKAKPILVAT